MERKVGLGSRALYAAMIAALALSIAALMPGVAGATSVAKTALLNEESVTFGDGILRGETPVSLEQWAAENAGYTVTVRSGEEWENMSAEEFAQYEVLIVGDPECSSTALSAVNSAKTWTPVVMGAGPNPLVGNRVVVGTDPEYHYAGGGGGARPTDPTNPATSGAEHLVQDGIAFAGGVAGATGVYFDTSCSDLAEAGEELARPHAKNAVTPHEIHQPTIEGPDGLAKSQVLEHLTLEPGHWTEDVSPPCGGSVSQIASNPVFSEGPTKLLDSDIQGWGCSDHITFPTFPTDWSPLAVATDTATKPTCGRDPEPPNEEVCGEAYVLLAGEGIVAKAPNLSLEPETRVLPAGGAHTVVANVHKEGNPVVGAVVTFLVTGTNAGVAGTCTTSAGAPDPECKTDEKGEVDFTYSDAKGAGKDTIVAGVTLESVEEEEELEIATARPAAAKVVLTSERATAVVEWVAAPAAPPAAKTAVLAAKAVAKVASGKASIARVVGCVASTSYLAAVHGTSISSVRFTLDGHTVKTLKHATSTNTYALRIKLRAGSKHHLSVHVSFTAASKTKATTLTRTLARCAARRVVAPRFTG